MTNITSDLEDAEVPPRLDTRTENNLLKRLERAAQLLQKRQLTRAQYSVIALDTIIRLYGKAGVRDEYSIQGMRFGHFDIPAPGWIVLMERTNLSFKESIDRYGDWNSIVNPLAEYQGRSREMREKMFEWDKEMAALLEESLLRLGRVNRYKFRVERWFERQDRYFPRLTGFLRTSSIAFGSAIIGALLGTQCQ